VGKIFGSGQDDFSSVEVPRVQVDSALFLLVPSLVFYLVGGDFDICQLSWIDEGLKDQKNPG